MSSSNQSFATQTEGHLHVVGISEMHISINPNDVLVTYSLGSCVGLSVFDPATGLGGLIHCMLPLSKIDPPKAEKNPCMFVDTGVPNLLQTMLRQGADRKGLVAKVAGGSSLLDQNGQFNIGQRNYLTLRKLLWKNDILLAAEDVGGTLARTMYLYMDTGMTTIKAQGRETVLE